MNYCNKQLPNRSKYADIAPKKCHKVDGHTGSCSEFPFLVDLYKTNKRVASKIKRDATMTTGAAWKSSDAGPNRILRWVMLQDDETLKTYGLDLTKLRTGIVAKLREKAASYEDCIDSAIKLTWLTYQMSNAPKPSEETVEYLEKKFGDLSSRTTKCEICLTPMSFDSFEKAKRGKALLETCHKNPRLHNPDNIGFSHRDCNIAQGSKTLDDFYSWIRGILDRVDKL